MYDHVVLVDSNDRVLGTEEKIAAHVQGLLHRAFSIFIFNNDGKMLLQQRASEKYHFSGIWSNSCCSHPRLDEDIDNAAHRRLQEELGFDTPLRPIFSFIYRAEDPQSGLIEHELDTVFVGLYNQPVFEFNPQEVAAVKWVSLSEAFMELDIYPDKYSLWYKIALLELRNRNLLSIKLIKELFS